MDDDDDYGYFDSLAGERGDTTLRGIRTTTTSDDVGWTFMGDGGQIDAQCSESFIDNLIDNHDGRELVERSFSTQFLRAFATTPPHFRAARGGRGGHRLRQNRNDTPDSKTSRDAYWKDSKPVYKEEKWQDVQAMLPILPPDTEIVSIKHTCLKQMYERLKNASGEWQNKLALFVNKTESFVPSLKKQATIVTDQFDDYGNVMYDYNGLECYDGMYDYVEIGNTANWTADERRNSKWFKISMTIDPRNINPGEIDVEPDRFPIRKVVPIWIPAPQNPMNRTLPPWCTKARTYMNPEAFLTDAHGAGYEWVPHFKKASAAAADPEPFDKILREIRSSIIASHFQIFGFDGVQRHQVPSK